MANNKWMTTFIYQQELKSYYMNNILYSIVRPGIYNADIKIVKNNGKYNLIIGKGTTFIFSNDYVEALQGNNSDRCYRRSFNTRNLVTDPTHKTESIYLIKCTALDDEVYELTIENDPPEFYYITAYFKYDPNNPNTDSSPSIKLFKNGSGGDGAYFISNDIPLIEGYDPFKGEESIYRDYKNRSFLHLGAITVDTDSKTIESFTSRGLPEYRYNLISDKMSINPDIIYRMSDIGKTIYVDLRNVIHKGNIYSLEADWERLYGLKGYADPESISSQIELAANGDKENKADVVFAVIPSPKNRTAFITLKNHENIRLVSYSLDLGDTFINNAASISDDIPLDTSISNVENLIAFTRNYNFIPHAIYRLVDDKILLPGDSVIPICIAFRNSDNINPANVLSLLDLEYKACKVNALSIDQDAYSIISVID